MFLSRRVNDLEEEFLPEEDYEYSNGTEIEEDTDTIEDTYENEEEEVDQNQDVFPNGTVIKFKCSQTRSGKYARWQIR